MSELVYIIHFLVMLGAFVGLWRVARVGASRIAAPEIFLFLISYLYITDTLVFGDAALNLWHYPLNVDKISTYRLFLPVIVIILYVTCVFLRPREKTIRATPPASQSPRFLKSLEGATLLFSCSVILVVVISGVVHYGSFNNFFDQLLSGRANRLQDIKFLQSGGQAPLFVLFSTMLPSAASILGMSAILNRGTTRVFSALLFFMAAFIVFSSGSRTALGLAILPIIYHYTTTAPRLSRILFSSSAIVLLLVVFGIMYDSRTEGIGTLLNDSKVPQIVYHQDNNYALTIAAMEIADETSFRFPANKWFGTMFFNMIPRAIWPGKPALDESDVFPYKMIWYTQGFIGEYVALFGNLGGFSASILYISIIFLAYSRLLQSIHGKYGRCFDAVLGIFLYMCMRSTLNISQQIYLLFPFIIPYLYAKVWSNSKLERDRFIKTLLHCLNN